MQQIARRSFLAVLALAVPALSLPTWADEAPVYVPVPASEVVEADLLFVKRPVIVFADSPNDPAFVRQMQLLERYLPQFEDRDVILITDTDPANPSALRKRLRPRGFSLVLMDKDWKPMIRKPLPWDGREIINSIDRMPIARTEALERNPAGR
ncbi:MAG: methylmalonyl-CoA epimerase [Rhodobacter sp.]|nr:methylmalonyl-CoA epimerase [Rhodobacter sp.]